MQTVKFFIILLLVLIPLQSYSINSSIEDTAPNINKPLISTHFFVEKGTPFCSEISKICSILTTNFFIFAAQQDRDSTGCIYYVQGTDADLYFSKVNSKVNLGENIWESHMDILSVDCNSIRMLYIW